MVTNLVIEGHRPVSWNKLYASPHWAKRKKLADEIHLLVRTVLDPNQKPYDFPVQIEITAFQKGRIVDPDNICAKLYIDGLHGWLLHDDTPEWVDCVILRSKRDKKNPRLEIKLTPIH